MLWRVNVWKNVCDRECHFFFGMKERYQGIIQEVNWGGGGGSPFFGEWGGNPGGKKGRLMGGGGGAVSPRCKPSPLFCYILLLDLLIWDTFFVNLFRMNSHLLNLQLGGQTNCPSTWIFFFCTLATAFPTSYHMKTVFSFWVWKLSNDACSSNLIAIASFLT